MLPEEDLARAFHTQYELLAPAFGYKTREASATAWEAVPEPNRRLMTEVCRRMLLKVYWDARAAIRHEAAAEHALLIWIVRASNALEAREPVEVDSEGS